jgi:hypothetical protein
MHVHVHHFISLLSAKRGDMQRGIAKTALQLKVIIDIAVNLPKARLIPDVI